MRSTASSPTPRCRKALTVTLRGMVQGMRASFTSFALGLCLAVVLLYLILVAQFQSFLDPFLILLAVPPGLAGVILTLWVTDTTLNVMSLMGVVMLVGIAVSNSILIVEFTRHLRSEGMAVREAVAMACRVRLRPVLMTSLATIIGLLPMALKLGAGSEAYAPLARAILGGLSVSVVLTVFLVPAAYLLVYAEPRPSGRQVISLIMRFLLIAVFVCRAPGARRPCTSRWRRRNSWRSKTTRISRRQVQRRCGATRRPAVQGRRTSRAWPATSPASAPTTAAASPPAA